MMPMMMCDLGGRGCSVRQPAQPVLNSEVCCLPTHAVHLLCMHAALASALGALCRMNECDKDATSLFDCHKSVSKVTLHSPQV